MYPSANPNISVKNPLALDYYELANEFFSEGNYKQALILYDKAISLEPRNTHLYNNRGNAFYRLGKYQQAIIDLNTAIKLDPLNSSAYLNRGNVISDMGNSGSSIRDYSKAIELQKDNTDAYFNRGVEYQQLNRWNESIKDFTKCIYLEPFAAQAYGYRGLAYAALGQYLEAKKDFEKSLLLNCDGNVDYKQHVEMTLRHVRSKLEKSSSYRHSESSIVGMDVLKLGIISLPTQNEKIILNISITQNAIKILEPLGITERIKFLNGNHLEAILEELDDYHSNTKNLKSLEKISTGLTTGIGLPAIVKMASRLWGEDKEMVTGKTILTWIAIISSPTEEQKVDIIFRR